MTLRQREGPCKVWDRAQQLVQQLRGVSRTETLNLIPSWWASGLLVLVTELRCFCVFVLLRKGPSITQTGLESLLPPRRLRIISLFNHI